MSLNNSAILAIFLTSAGCGDATSAPDSSSESGADTMAAETSVEPTSTGDTDTSSSGSDSICGDAALGAGEECDDGANNGPGRKCLPDCTNNVCGDGDLFIGIEECDDGNQATQDGCDSACLLEGTCANSVILNSGFEDGSLAPWETIGSATVNQDNPHDGGWSAEINGNVSIVQKIVATPSERFTNASFWSWHDIKDEPLLLVELTYEDGTLEKRVIGLDLKAEPLDGWVKHNFLGELDVGRQLVEVRVWGYASMAPSPDLTRLDTFNFCALP